jgi:hypothetical protein
MNSVAAPGRRFVSGGIIAACLLGVAAVLQAGAPQSPQGGLRLFQGGGQGTGSTSSGRMIVLMVDANSMSSSEAQTLIAAALEWVDGTTDQTSIVTVGANVNVLSDFTSDRVALRTMLRSDQFRNAIIEEAPGPQAIRFGGTTDAQNPDAARAADLLLAEQRIRGIKTVCETVSPIPSRKAIVYFSKGFRAPGDATYVASLRAATTACNRANATLNPIDARGLVAAVPAPK